MCGARLVSAVRPSAVLLVSGDYERASKVCQPGAGSSGGAVRFLQERRAAFAEEGGGEEEGVRDQGGH
ncbi:hypothetical protein NDU88_007798 [Pleurodeles waltl]|uniref:Uncharacterized protein n=1 Tax=Pleurodeles waltl TaxID=8319 RepID=A0AAV7QQ08_PLEWA|nr:hypothetical protein NDU88_007798 [Pleurodeles waltl]